MSMNRYETLFLPADEEGIRRGGALIAAGELVAFPTETVYGLGANAYDAAAVRAIFEAKGRPQDNPLIVHIASQEQLIPLVRCVPETAQALLDRYWPGPLTVIFPKSDRVPMAVTAGLSTVAVRMPGHPAARKLIEAAGVPIAAPSANRSGLPSPTRAEHVRMDMQGRIALILDGGPCQVGVESTVVDLSGEVPILLRPGAVTREMLCQVFGQVRVSHGVLQALREGEPARSPGMKHRHYAPQFARALLLQGQDEAVVRYIVGRSQDHPGKCAAVVKHSLALRLPDTVRVRDAGSDDAAYAATLFDALRDLDDGQTQLIFCQAVDTQGLGLALMNRLLRASGFETLQV